MNAVSIVGEWVHAHERDHANCRVFVSADESLPPSRGRRRLSFHADGTYVDAPPGADDRAACVAGVYQFDGNVLLMHRPDNAPCLSYDVGVASDGKRLELTRT